jgi:hypothetical protein
MQQPNIESLADRPRCKSRASRSIAVVKLKGTDFQQENNLFGDVISTSLVCVFPLAAENFSQNGVIRLFDALHSSKGEYGRVAAHMSGFFRLFGGVRVGRLCLYVCRAHWLSGPQISQLRGCIFCVHTNRTTARISASGLCVACRCSRCNAWR